jgi:hypothetical protein
VRSLLRRYWFEFDLPPEPDEREAGRTIDDRPVAYLRNGVGITGYDEDDCLQLLRDQVFRGEPLPAVRQVIQDIDVRTIPPWFHTHNQVGVPVWRGVWAPPFNLWLR